MYLSPRTTYLPILILLLLYQVAVLVVDVDAGVRDLMVGTTTIPGSEVDVAATATTASSNLAVQRRIVVARATIVTLGNEHLDLVVHVTCFVVLTPGGRRTFDSGPIDQKSTNYLFLSFPFLYLFHSLFLWFLCSLSDPSKNFYKK